MALIEVQVPDIGDLDEVAVIELMVKVGDTVKAEQSLITVESDKASMEIPSSTAGVVKELRVALGDKVKQGTVVLVLEAAGADSVPNQAGAQVSPAPAAPVFVAPSKFAGTGGISAFLQLGGMAVFSVGRAPVVRWWSRSSGVSRTRNLARELWARMAPGTSTWCSQPSASSASMAR